MASDTTWVSSTITASRPTVRHPASHRVRRQGHRLSRAGVTHRLQRIDVGVVQADIPAQGGQRIAHAQPLRGDHRTGQDLAHFRLGAAAMGSGAQAQCAVHVVGQVTNGEPRHSTIPSDAANDGT